jgi:hypothetical protein
MAAILGNAVPPPEVPLKTDDAAKPHQSSGGNSTTVTETVKQVKAVGAFNPQLAVCYSSTVSHTRGLISRANPPHPLLRMPTANLPELWPYSQLYEMAIQVRSGVFPLRSLEEVWTRSQPERPRI